MKAELAGITDEQERLRWFEEAVKDFDKADELNDLKHRRKNRRHSFDPCCLDIDSDEEVSIPKEFKTLNTDEGWLDYIYSRTPEGLHELVEDEEVSRALQSLNIRRKGALFYRAVHGYTTRETADLQGVSGRNVRKLYEKAIEEIRKKLTKD
jgi:RNA polymerase sigma factor (sigma-70 family)